jgi:hypothetical protein
VWALFRRIFLTLDNNSSDIPTSMRLPKIFFQRIIFNLPHLNPSTSVATEQPFPIFATHHRANPAVHLAKLNIQHRIPTTPHTDIPATIPNKQIPILAKPITNANAVNIIMDLYKILDYLTIVNRNHLETALDITCENKF